MSDQPRPPIQPQNSDQSESVGDTQPMQPLSASSRRGFTRPERMSMSGRQRRPPIGGQQAEDEEIEEITVEEAPPVDEYIFDYEASRPRAAHREVDPLVAYLMIVALGIGIAPLDPLPRYIVLWTLMSFLGSMAYLLGGVERMGEAKIDDLFWGMTFGFVSSFPFLVVFGSQLATVSERMFDAENTPALVMDTWVFMAVAFVIPLTETLFFRGGMQGVRSLFLTTGLATLWSAALFFPHMELGGNESIGVILLIVFLLLNFMYSYMRFRNGLAAAWLCQVVSYTMLWFVPRLLF